jgi:hypothetical protein
MVKVISRGDIRVECKNCHSVLSLEHIEAIEKNTSPPMWYIECPVCYMNVSLTCAHGAGALIGQHIHDDPVGAFNHSSAARIWGKEIILQTFGYGEKKS